MKEVKTMAYNPFLPIDTYIADGEPHVFDDRVYLFGSHDKEAGDTFCMLSYEFFSAPVNDLGNWTSKGINYEARQDPLYSEEMRYMYAPDCVKGNDGRYYLYYCLSGYKGRGGYKNPISVAVCDTPDGKYEYYGYVRKKDGSPYLDTLCFDPAVINDDGIIRLYFGSDYPWFDSFVKPLRKYAIAKVVGRPTKEIPDEYTGSYHVELSEDMLTIKDKPKRIDHEIKGEEYKKHQFFEGSSIRKIDDTYYFIYSSTNNHELCYATSKYPDREFTYGGTIVSNGDIGYKGRKPKDRLNRTGTNHGSIEKINDQYYVFYHRLTHNSDYSRQACAEKIEILPDGSIPQVEITSCGLNDGYLKEGIYPSVICCNLTNGKMKHGSNKKETKEYPCIGSKDDERFVKDISDNTSIVYKYFELEGSYYLKLLFKGDEGKITVYLNDTLSSDVKLYPHENWFEYITTLKTDEGVYALKLKYTGKGKASFKQFELKKF